MAENRLCLSLFLLIAVSVMVSAVHDVSAEDTTASYTNMTIDELEGLYNYHTEYADMIMTYIQLPSDQRPSEFRDKTIYELYRIYEFHIMEAERILGIIISMDVSAEYCGNNMCSPDESCQTCPEDCGECAPLTDATDGSNVSDWYNNLTLVITAPGETANTETGDETITENETPVTEPEEVVATEDANTSADLEANASLYNITGVIAARTPDYIEYMRNVLSQVKEDEWKKYESYSAYREAIGQQYENPAITRRRDIRMEEVLIDRISAGMAVRIDMKKPLMSDTQNYSEDGIPVEADIPVTFVDFSVNNDVERVELRIGKIDSSPTSEDGLANSVYEYVEIEKTGIMDDDIDDVGIGFKVRKSWIDGNHINTSEMALFRLVGENWTELPTRIVSEDSENVYYEAQSDGFSYFAIGITAAVLSPVIIDMPDPAKGAGVGEEDNIVSIRFSWILVLIIIAFIVILKYAYISRKVKDIFHRESEGELQKMIDEFSRQRKEALNQYYRREITNEQMNQIINGIKEKEFGVQMRMKKLKEKSGGIQ
ncbi:MAG: PGF-pre-PGF domain-containing protein [Candidatus Aenigmarchaeota archaeon]|nr:PGF-pre-PGF domain-containing protein [Candidatus Aenigmarchaeota archaeon]